LPTHGRETILVVEDQVSVRELCRHVLADAGYGVLEAGDGVAALEIFHARNGAIDLLLCDVVMPRMKGPQLAAQLDALGARVPILLMTGYADAQIRQSLRSGDDLLLKPFHPQQLLQRVRSLLDAAATRTDLQPGVETGMC
jgi:CheY-like chemotaxis protein